MPTNKQRREAARRHLERQLQRRQEDTQKRKQRNLIVTIVGVVVVLVALVLVVIVATGNSGKKKPAASASTSPTAPASDSTDASSTAPAGPTVETNGPCGYTKSGTATKDVGIPPDPNPTPTTNRTLSINSTQGAITISLDASIAPCTVQSIAFLATQKYYDGTKCHRVTDETGLYVLQCGDPAGDGSGGPGYESKDENLTKADYSVVGTVAMANGGPGTDGSQFFIIWKDSSSLPKSYTEIGHVTAGMDVVQKVAAAGSDNANGTGDGAPKLPITFTTVTATPPVTGTGTVITTTPTPTASGSTTPSAASS